MFIDINAKQNSLCFRDLAQLNFPVPGFPLFGGGNIVPGIAVVPPMHLTYYGNDYNELGLAVFIIKS